MRKLKRHNSVNKNFNAKLLWKRTAAFYASSLCEEIICYSNYDKENSIAGISISFMLLTIYKEIQIGSGKLLNQYKQKTWQNPEYEYFWKNIRNSENIQKTGILACNI